MAEQKSSTAPPAEDRGRETPGAEARLADFLAGIREQRGLSRDAVVQQSGIPAHYVQMIETGDYSLISDPFYLLPFLRKYAAFLRLDPEETVTRFLREAPPADERAIRMPQPWALGRRTNRLLRWLLIAALAGALVVFYLIMAERRRLVAPVPLQPAAPSPTSTMPARSAPVPGPAAAPLSAPPGARSAAN